MRAITVFGGSVLLAFVIFACGGSMIKEGTVMGQPSQVCLVAGFINTFSGHMIADMSFSTSGALMETVGDGKFFALPNVPKGPVSLQKMTITDGAAVLGSTYFFEKNKVNHKGFGKVLWYDLEKNGSTEMIQGNCDGGFVWVGEFDVSAGSFSKGVTKLSVDGSEKALREIGQFPVTLKSDPDPDRRVKAVKMLKKYFAGSPWEPVIK